MIDEYTQRVANSFAIQNGYLGANWLIRSEEKDVFAPIEPEDAPREFIGFPRYIVVENNGARWCSSFEETRSIMHAIADSKEKE